MTELTDHERKAACELAIQAALSQFNCLLVPTIATDTQGNLYRDQMSIRLMVLPAPEKPQTDATGFVDPAAVNVVKKKHEHVVPNGAKVETE